MWQVKSEKAAEFFLGRLNFSGKWHSRAYILQRSVDLSDDAYMSYKPLPLDIKILLFRVSERTQMRMDDPYLGWDGLSIKGIRDYEVHGFHKNILKEPNVKLVAEKLKRILEQTARR
jgi:thioesterase domain-containing protein